MAYAQGVLHGSDFRNFELRRIADGVLVAHYEFPHEEAATALAHNRAPGWVRSVPEYLRRRYDYRAHIMNAASFAVVTILMC